MKSQVSILAFDLGKTMGWARCSCSVRPELKMTVVDQGTIYFDQLATEYMRKNYNEIYSRPRVRMILFEDIVRKLTSQVKYDAFVVEDIFLNPKRVSAFRSLMIYMETLERIVNTEKMMRLHTVPTRVCKQHISGFGGSDKSEVQDAVLTHPNIVVKKPNEMSEHESDAVAVAWAMANSYLNSLT